MKGYFLGAKKKKDGMLACFRQPNGKLLFGFYDDWKPEEYIITSGIALGKNLRKLEELELQPEPTGMKYGKHTKIAGKELAVLKVHLQDFTQKNSLWKNLKDLEKKRHLEDIFAVYPDSGNGLSYEVRFCQDMGLVWQSEYDIDSGGTDGFTPDGTPIHHINSLEPTGKENKNVGMMSFDIETNVKNGDIVLLSLYTEKNNREKAWVYAQVPPRWHGKEDEFSEKFLQLGESSPEVVPCSSNRDLVEKFSKKLEKDLNEWCDVLVGYNNKYFDQVKIYETAKKEGTEFKGKGGYKFNPIPTANTGVTFFGFTYNMDVYLFVNKGRIGKLGGRGRLKDVEKSFGISEREGEIRGIDTWKLYENPELYKNEILHNLYDVRSTYIIAEKTLEDARKIIRKIKVPPDYVERRPDREIEGLKFNQWCLNHGIVPGMFNPYSARKFKEKAFTQKLLRVVKNEDT